MARFPQPFGRYQLIKRIAVGGMAEIFHAKVVGSLGFEKNLIIKRILPELVGNPEFLRMFVTEARLVCHLEHPNIAQVLELGEVDGQYFIAMEHVNGIDARVLWRTLAKNGQRLPLALALHIVAEFLKGLDYAHQSIGSDGRTLGVVHRDVSLSNVLLSYLGEVKIGDFGIALIQLESRGESGLKGKYGYMSPEQLAGQSVDHRTDIFSSGVVLAELLLGRRLFRAETDAETIDNVLRLRLDLLDEHEGAFPRHVMAIVRRALERRVEDRYQTAGDFQEALSAYLHTLNSRVSNKTLSAFIAGHVAPTLASEGREPTATMSLAEDDPPAPDRIADGTSSDVTPSLDAAADESTVDQRTTEPSGADFNISVDSLIPLGAFLSGSPEASPPLAEGAPDVTGPPLDEARIVERVAPRAELRSGEQEFAEAAATELPLLTETEAEDAEKAEKAARLAAILGDGPAAGKKAVPKPDSAASTLGASLSGQLPSALEPEGEPDFSGDLESITLTRVIFRLVGARESGLLVLTGPIFTGRQAELFGSITRLQRERSAATDARAQVRRTCHVHLERGVPDMVSADRSEEALVAYLARVGVLSMETIRAAIEKHPERKLIDALITLNRLTPFQITRNVNSFVLWSLLDAFSWSWGRFLFHRGRSCAPGACPTGHRGVELIAKGISYIEEPALECYFSRLSSYSVIAEARPTIAVEALDPSPLAAAIWDELHTARSLPETIAVCGHLGDTLRARRTLYMMIECGVAVLFDQSED